MNSIYLLYITAILFSASVDKPFVADSSESKGNINVRIENCESDKGQVMVALFNTETSFGKNDEAYKGMVLPAKTGQLTKAAFENVPYGTYAIGVYHDVNNNGIMDTRIFGIPTEPYGFSTNPVIKWEAPTFKGASFELSGEVKELNISVKRWENY